MDQIVQEYFKSYEISSNDEMFNKDGSVKEHWEILAQNLNELNTEELVQKQFEIDWLLKDNGVTYNIYTDRYTKRKWYLDPIPFILNKEEWANLTAGIEQRARLFDRIFKDIYGEQKLLKEGIVPAEIFYQDTHLIREVYGFDKDYFNLYFYAADLSRGPDGQFWVVSDRTNSPSGLGYAIENRLTINTVNGDLIKNIHIHRISKFIDGFKRSISKYTNQEDPYVVMLSPGPYNETYFEQSYLANILDFELVRGEDLLVKDSTLYLKNLKGLKKVDIIIRRVDDKFCDPLELKNDSQLGVPGLLKVLREGNALMINPIGIGVLENLGINPFMNNICKYFFDEPLKIPQIATWWCGQAKERKYVLENIDQLIIKSIDKYDPEDMYICSNLDHTQIEQLKSRIEKNPFKFIAQEKIEFSSTPSFTGKTIDSRKNSVRIFCYKDDENYHVMDGGLVRISSDKDTFIVSNQKGGGSKDLWILSDQEDLVSPLLPQMSIIDEELSLASLTTKKAENIFWLGRYLQRSIISARVIRLYLKKLMQNKRSEDIKTLSIGIKIYGQAITHLTMTYPGFLEKKVDTFKELNSILKDINRVGSFSFTLSMLSNVNINIKNLLSSETSKVFDKLESRWYEHAESTKINYIEHAEALDDTSLYLSAYKELVQESISFEQGLVFYEIGSNVEMALLFISKMRSLATMRYKKHIEYEVLQFLLLSYEGLNAYKSLYKSNITLPMVIDFLIFQKNYPKSLFNIIKNLKELMETLQEDEILKPSSKIVQESIDNIYEKLQSIDKEILIQKNNDQYVYPKLDSFLNDISTLLIQFSNEFIKNLFAHYYE